MGCHESATILVKHTFSNKPICFRRETLESREKTESLFRAFSSYPHIHLATDYNTVKYASVSWSLREYDPLLESVPQNMFSRIALVQQQEAKNYDGTKIPGKPW